jgi:hypothetical protein
MRAVLIACSGLTKDEYPTLSEAVQKSGQHWWHFLDSVWIVETTETAEDMGDRLADIVREMGKEQKVLAIEITGRYEGWLPKKAWDWMSRHVKKETADRKVS